MLARAVTLAPTATHRLMSNIPVAWTLVNKGITYKPTMAIDNKKTTAYNRRCQKRVNVNGVITAPYPSYESTCG